MVTSGTGHDRCPSQPGPDQAPGRHQRGGDKKISKAVFGFKGDEKFFGLLNSRRFIDCRASTADPVIASRVVR
jgi:hypothetical protein